MSEVEGSTKKRKLEESENGGGAQSDTRFSGKTIVVTGAGGNFGREGCIYFALRGAKVAALDNNSKALEETLTDVKAKCGTDDLKYEIESFVCDVTDADGVQSVIDKVVSKFSRIDLLWNNAGYQGQIKPTLEYSPSDFATVMNVNVTGMFIILQAVAKQMVKQEEGTDDGDKTGSSGTSYSIVNTASVAGLRGTPAMIAYASSKAAVLAMTVSASKDLAPSNIRVNAISPALIGPGFMWTRQNELHAKSGSPYFATDPDVVAKNKVNSVPMKRLGSITEVLQSVAFLLSTESSYTTGTNIVVDGGMSSGLKA